MNEANHPDRKNWKVSKSIAHNMRCWSDIPIKRRIVIWHIMNWPERLVVDLQEESTVDLNVGNSQAENTQLEFIRMGFVSAIVVPLVVLCGTVYETNAFTDIALSSYSWTGTTGYKILGPATSAFLAELVPLRDFNGDSIDDFAVAAGAATANSRTNSGIVYIIFCREMAHQQRLP